MFILAIFVLFAGSVFWAAFFRLPTKPAYLLALYLLSVGNIVLTEYIANTFFVLNKPEIILIIHAILLFCGWLAWQSVKKPALAGPFRSFNVETLAAIKWLKSELAIAIFTTGMTLLYLFGLAQIVLIPQNSMDGLSTYLSRIGFWLQNGSFFPWETSQLSQVVYPVNAQLQTYWTLLFLNNDCLVGSVQWIAVLASGLSVWGIARLIGYSRRQSAFSTLIYLSFPLILLQSTTAQTDLVTTVFFVIATYFLLLGLKEQNNLYLTLFSISAGIGIGTKKSFLLLLLLFGIILILAFAQYGKRIFKQVPCLAVSSILATLIFGSYIYIINWQSFGSVLGPQNYVEQVLYAPNTSRYSVLPRLRLEASSQLNIRKTNIRFVKPEDIAEELLYNIPRLIYQSLDVSGLPRPLSGYAHKTKAFVASTLINFIGFEEIEGTTQTAPGHEFYFLDKPANTEDESWYGPLSALLLFPAVVYGFFLGVKEKNYIKAIPLLSFFVYLPLEVILRPGWDPYQGRYFAPIIALSAPLLGNIFNAQKARKTDWLISAFAIMLAMVTMLYNPAKPTLGKFADEFHIWDNDRIFLQTIQQSKERDLYYMIEKNVPEQITLGYYIPFYFLNYPLFGESFTRTLLPIVNRKNISDIQWLENHQIDFLLLPDKDNYPLPPPEYNLINSLPDWQLYQYVPE